MAAAVPAALAADTAQTGTINYYFQIDGAPVSGVSLRLYKVGTIDANGTNLTNAPDGCLNEDGSINESAAVSLLTGMYDADASTRKPLRTGVTDADGACVFDNLENGIYLITGDPTDNQESGISYWPTAMLVSVPGKDTEDSELSNVRTVYAKPLQADVTVLKQWKNDTASNRPEEITVELKAVIDGKTKVIDTVTLTAKGNWTYCWTDLDPNLQYSVNEQTVPSGYTVSVSGMTITNTYTCHTDTLPQTGLNWWPVILLAAAGIACIAIGVKRRHGD